jgi:hypothetical protein
LTRISFIIFGILFCALFLVTTATFAQRDATPNPHGPLALPCENCHNAAGWSPILDRPRFNHNQTKFPLRGGHDKLSCTECHAKAVFSDVGRNCDDCHADIHLRKFGSDCAQCHIAQGWFTSKQQVRNHNNLFPLIGAHAAVECEGCHKSLVGGQYRVLPYCSACHMPEYRKTTSPNHQAKGFPLTCDSCHSQDSWLGAFSPQTRFSTLGRRNGAGH